MCFKRNEGVGGTLKGQRRPVRPTTAGGHRRHSGTGGFLKVAVTIHWRRKTIGDALECLKRQDGEKGDSKMSASHSATIRQRESYDAILDREALQGGFCGPLEQRSRLESVLAFQEARWSRRLQRFSVAHCDHTTVGGRRQHSETGGFGKWLLRSKGGKRPKGRR